MKKTMITVALSALVVACATFVPLTPAQTDLDRAMQKYPGITMADLNNGKAIFEKKCEKCHSLARPFKVSEKDFLKIMPKMAKKANIDDKSADLVQKYILVMRGAQKKM